MAELKFLLICLDYDDTYTRDPILWYDFIRSAKKRGHRIICATMRYEQEGEIVEHALAQHVEKIIYTDRKAKKPFLEKFKIYPDIWIDDSPEWLLNDG